MGVPGHIYEMEVVVVVRFHRGIDHVEDRGEKVVRLIRCRETIVSAQCSQIHQGDPAGCRGYSAGNLRIGSEGHGFLVSS